MIPLRFEGARGEFIIKGEDVLLRPWLEAIGIVDSVETFNGSAIIRILLTRCIRLEIPIDELMTDGVKLEQLKGQKISILRTDEEYILKQSEPDGDIGSKVP